jgi:hypothetical protein
LIVVFFKFKKANVKDLGTKTDKLTKLILLGIGIAGINYFIYLTLSRFTDINLSTIVQQNVTKHKYDVIYIFTAVIWGPPKFDSLGHFTFAKSIT